MNDRSDNAADTLGLIGIAYEIRQLGGKPDAFGKQKAHKKNNQHSALHQVAGLPRHLAQIAAHLDRAGRIEHRLFHIGAHPSHHGRHRLGEAIGVREGGG